MTILCPASENELKLMLNWAFSNEEPKTRSSGPVIIRYPKAYCPKEVQIFSQPLETGRGTWLKKNSDQICLVFTGSLYNQALHASDILKEDGIETDLYNLRFIKPIDEDYLAAILNSYKLICFIEEGMKEGGFSEYAVSLSQKRKCTAVTLVLAVESKFLEEDCVLGTREELLVLNNLDGNGIAKIIKQTVKNS